MSRSRFAHKGMSWRMFILIMVSLIILILIALRSIGNEEKVVSETGRFSHVHGLGFDDGGKILTAAVHEGLMRYENGKWMSSEGESHDYMGYAPTHEGFFSSGHPALGSDLPNPLGIVRSADGGVSVESIAFAGGIDFHILGAGYNSKVLYVYQPESTAFLEQGLYFSQNEGENWTLARHDGLSGEIRSLAVHPNQPETVALGTSTGAYISSDFGQTFTPIMTNALVTALSFGPTGKIYVASYQDELAQIAEIVTEAMKINSIDIPSLQGEIVSYIAVNTLDEHTLAFATSQSQIYITGKGRKEWNRITE